MTMRTSETPTITKAMYLAKATALSDMALGHAGSGFGYTNQTAAANDASWVTAANIPARAIQGRFMQQHTTTVEKTMTEPKRRIVQVFIADTDERVPLDKSVIYTGKQKLTDLTDQELFFEIDIKTLLDVHNAERIKIVDKTVKDRTEHLEPVRIRDLKMVVVTIAGF